MWGFAEALGLAPDISKSCSYNYDYYHGLVNISDAALSLFPFGPIFNEC